MAAPIELSVLGALEVRHDGRPVELGALKQRALVAVLAMARGWPVSVDAIVDVLWGDDPPPGVSGTLQSYVSQLRRVLEPDRAPRAPATVLVTAAPGYALRLPDERYDAHRFEHAVHAAHRRLQPLAGLGPSPLDRAALERERGALDDALALWRGTPYAELGETPDAVAERSRLEELRLLALEDRALASLALGDHATTAAELEALTAAHPLRERLWALRAVALARSGRQADALDVLRRVREVLDEELGIEPSADLRELQTALLRQDQRLEWVAPAAGEPGPPGPLGPPGPEPAAAEPPPRRRPEEEQVAPWPMVGRDAELAALLGLVQEAEAGAPAAAVLTGEPGIGKSRLAAEVMLQARRRGAQVVVGRCTQDEGAPPLWPWKAVLDGLGADLLATVQDAGGGSGEDEGGRFRAWERVVDVVRRAAGDRPTVVLLDDLHWADVSTLRVLRLLLETMAGERLLVIGTWRSHPAPSGALADVAETFARRHALRVDLAGLGERDVRTVFEAVARSGAGVEESRLLLTRTDGNPFFLVELARLAAEGGRDVDLAGGRLPTAVGEVIDRRLGRLPDETVAALRVAAVIGRRFDLTTLAAAARIDEDDALDVVEPAQAAGLLRDHGIDHYLFTHALVRDRLREGLSASRLARLHARIAEALGGAPGRETEEAQHWREAGPAHAGRAWRAAVVAAALVRRLHDHDQAAELLAAAVASQEQDPSVTDRERWEVRMELIDALRWAARLADLVAVAEEAIAIARRLGDPEALGWAAISASHGVLWRSAPPGQVNEVVLSALHDALAQLPEGDSELRCRVLLALAMEADDTDALERRAEPVAQALAMARRVDDPGLRMSAGQIGFIAQWVPSTAVVRLAMVTEATRLARSVGDERAYVVSATLRTAALSELGLVDEMWEQLAAARTEAARLRIRYGDLVLTGLETSWLAMAGRFDECRRNLDRLAGIGEDLDHEDVELVIAAATVAVRYWRPEPDAIPLLEGFVEMGVPFGASIAVHLCRTGQREAALRYLAEHPVEPGPEGQLAPLTWSHAAELASYVDDTELAEASYRLLLPLAGRPVSAGSGIALGPVDAYLAMAAATVGRTDDAAHHLDAAAEQAARHDLTEVTAWIGTTRDRLGL